MRYLAALLIACSACSPHACNEEDERALVREVEALTGEPGSIAGEAERRLIERGRPAIVQLEVGLYEADVSGRLRIIKVLERMGDAEAIPILEHLVLRDPDETVRDRARRAIERLGPDS